MTSELSRVMKIRRLLEGACENKTRSTEEILDALKVLERCNLSLELLQKSGIGITVNRLRKEVSDAQVSTLVKKLLKSWKRCLSDTSGRTSGSSQKPTTPKGTGMTVKSKKARSVVRPVIRPYASSSSPGIHSPPVIPPSSSPVVPPPTVPSSSPACLPSSPPSSTSSSTLPATTSPHNLSNTRLSNGLEPAQVSLESADSQQFGTSSNPSLNFPASVSGCECAPSTGSDVRDRCRELLVTALKKDCKEVTQEEEYKFYNLSSQIEECIFDCFGDTGTKYKQRVRSRVSNLSDAKNLALRQQVITGDISPAQLARMTADAMASDYMKELRQRLTEEAIRDAQVAQTDGAGGTECDLIRCPECSKNKCTYTQAQTLQSDEPMTTFAYCNECGYRWIFY